MIAPARMHLPGHHRYPFAAIGRRPDYSWPHGKRLAFYVAISSEHFAFGAGLGEDISTPGAPQTQRNYGWRDYGQRVGLWNLIETLTDLKLPLAHAVNGLLYQQRPQLVERLHASGAEIVAHGRTSAEMQNDLWEHDEAHLIREVTNAIAKQAGKPPSGWLGPGFGETRVTVDLLKEAGYDYVLDWPADDQPFWLKTRSGPLLSVPYPLELNDVTALLHRRHSARQFGDMIVNQFEVMLAQSERQPLVFALGLHAYIAGQPFRLRAIRQALKHCLAHKDSERLWLTRPGDIAQYCRQLPPGIIPGA
ncbi:MAG TPA: polysaccharide deacetylase family protein [Burkholderiales bacterium]|nr:polysaccharide deacetylase family protein [Burkholderiales bacterium]